MASFARLRSGGETIPLRLENGAARASCAANDTVFFFDSCTSAIAAGIQAARSTSDIERPEVLLPAYGSPALLQAVRLARLEPRFADLQRDGPWLDVENTERELNERTLAVVAVRFMGLPGTTAALRSRLAPPAPAIIDDCAHCMPCAVPVDSDCDVAAFSFNRGKPVSGGGGGALLVTVRSRVSSGIPALPPVLPRPLSRARETLRVALRNVAIQPLPYGVVSRLLPLLIERQQYRSKSSIVGIRADHLGRALTAAADQASYLRERLRLQVQLSRLLGQLPGEAVTDLPHRASAVDSMPLWRYPVLFCSRPLRDRCYAALTRAGLGPSTMYDRLLPEEAGYAGSASRFPNAWSFLNRVLTLPLHSAVLPDHLARMHEVISEQVALAGRR